MSIRQNAMAQPRRGARGMNFMVSRSLSQRRTSQPAWATPAPAKQPISACDERGDDDVGDASHPSHGSGVLQHDALDDVRDVLASVGRVLQVLVDLLPLDDRDRVLLLLEETRNGRAQDGVPFVLQSIDVDAL